MTIIIFFLCIKKCFDVRLNDIDAERKKKKNDLNYLVYINYHSLNKFNYHVISVR